MKNYHFAVFIGRFQPFHNGHLQVVLHGLEQAEQIIVLCGSAHIPPSLRNPWSFQDRKSMILGSFSEQDGKRITVLPLIDSPYNNAIWIQSVQTIVAGVTESLNRIPHEQPKIALIGHKKDQSSFYLKMFPQWDSIEVGNLQSINATTIRQAFFSQDGGEKDRQTVMENSTPKGTQFFIKQYYPQPELDYIVEENSFLSKYQQAWADSPYPPVFVTVDAVVVLSGHVLLVKRRARPGKGLYALPGGFVGQHEQLLDACIRELREETQLKVPEPVLRGSIIRNMTFDDPYRSCRGRTITQAFLFELADSEKLPKVKGGDDAAKAFWLPLAEVEPEMMFEDHYFIIRHLLGE